MLQPIIKTLGMVDYAGTLTAMKSLTELRTSNTTDEFWILEHPPVFTLGLAGNPEHILQTTHGIPTIRCDRGGQVTYHGPGQLVVYMLIDLKRAKLSIRDLVTRIENGVIAYLASLKIDAHGDRAAPGVYVANKKIASLGLKVRKGCTYHGLSFNVNMDLTPFNFINVCGYQGLQVTQLCDLLQDELVSVRNVSELLTSFLLRMIYAKD